MNLAKAKPLLGFHVFVSTTKGKLLLPFQSVLLLFPPTTKLFYRFYLSPLSILVVLMLGSMSIALVPNIHLIERKETITPGDNALCVNNETC